MDVPEAQSVRTVYLRIPRKATKLQRRLRRFLQRVLNEQMWTAMFGPLTADLLPRMCKEFVVATASACMRILYTRPKINRKYVYLVRKEDILHTLTNSLPTQWFTRQTKSLSLLLDWVATEATLLMNSRLCSCSPGFSPLLHTRWHFSAPNSVLSHAARMWNNILTHGSYAGDGNHIIPIIPLAVGDAERD